jgi:GDP-L-fucose synthase
MKLNNNRRIVVTGGNGFLGRFVISELEKQGYKDIFIPQHKDYDLVIAADVKRLYADYAPNVLIHLAAVVGGIGANQASPATLFYENAMMGIQIIEEGRRFGTNKLVIIGTICAYPKYTPVPFKEENLWNGYPEETNAPYGLAKKMLLVQSQAYRQQYGLNAIYLLPVNLFGPGDNFDPFTSHVIPAMIRKVYEAREQKSDHITLWGSGRATREFLYVEDAARGIVLATNYYDKADPINLGSGQEISVAKLADLICNLMDYKGEIRWDTSKPDGQPRRCLDVQKAKKEFDFSATTSFEEGLKKTISWYERNANDNSNANIIGEIR